MIDVNTHAVASRPASPDRVGLIGVGLMGLAIAERLREDLREVVGWDIAPQRRAALSRLGGAVASDGAEVMAACDRVVFSLPDPDVVESVLRQANASLRRGQIIVDTSTGDPPHVVQLGRKLARKGLSYLDATVSGSSAQVRKGEVVLMVGGTREAFDRCQDLFRLFSKQAIHTGPCGSGAKMKLVTNLVLGLNRAALAEGLTFARMLGLSGDHALRVLRASMAYSRIMDTKGEKMLRGDFAVQAKLSQHLKDVKLILATAAKARAKLPLSDTHRKLLEQAELSGFGDLDNSAVIRAIEQLNETQS